MSESRVGICWLTRHCVSDLLSGLVDGRCLTLKVQSVIPRDAKCLDVCYDFRRDCFGLKLEHPSFPPIFEGQELTNLNYFFGFGPATMICEPEADKPVTISE